MSEPDARQTELAEKLMSNPRVSAFYDELNDKIKMVVADYLACDVDSISDDEVNASKLGDHAMSQIISRVEGIFEINLPANTIEDAINLGVLTGMVTLGILMNYQREGKLEAFLQEEIKEKKGDNDDSFDAADQLLGKVFEGIGKFLKNQLMINKGEAQELIGESDDTAHTYTEELSKFVNKAEAIANEAEISEGLRVWLSLRTNMLRGWLLCLDPYGDKTGAIRHFQEVLSKARWVNARADKHPGAAGMIEGLESDVLYRLSFLTDAETSIKYLEKIIAIEGNESPKGVMAANKIDEIRGVKRAEAKKGGCFIATACYGDRFSPQVVMLRDFRDRKLLTTSVGRMLVGFYYAVSPPLADFITSKDRLRRLVRRFMIEPLVYVLKPK